MSEFNLDKVIRLLDNANEQGINVSFADDGLSVRYKKGQKIESGILDELKLNKPFLIHYFQTYANKTDKLNYPPLTKSNSNEQDGRQLSFAQERLWFIDQLEGSVQYHIPSVLKLKGSLDVSALTNAIQHIVNRHQVLRTVILQKNGKASQHVKPKDGWALNNIDGYIYNNDPLLLQNFTDQLISEPFDLSKDYMIRAHLIKLKEQDYVFVVALHHIASDGWSTSIIVRELVDLYNAFSKKRPSTLPPQNIQYSDYALWQREYLQGEILTNKLSYWKNKLLEVPNLQLPLSYGRPAVQSMRGASVNFHFNKNLFEKVQAISHQQGATLFMTMLAGFNVLLHRYSGQNDICVGTPVAGRDQQEVESLIGFFINTLALRINLAGNPSFVKLLRQVKTTTLEAFDHKDLPFEKVVDAVVKERDISRSPVFQVIFILQNLPEVPKFKLGDVEMIIENTGSVTAKYDLAFSLTPTHDGLYGNINYCVDLFSKETIVKISEHFVNLFESIVEDPFKNIGELSMLSASEQHKLITEFNNTADDFAGIKNKNIVTFFEQKVIENSSLDAIVFRDEKLTYAELNEKANQLAHYLQAKGVTNEFLVAINIERSLEMIVGILGILKAGGAYVPIDAAYPPDRIDFILKDTLTKIILTSSEVKTNLVISNDCEAICLDANWAEIAAYSTANLTTSINTYQLAYIIYTSGSTGKPKGVMIEHGGVVNLACSQAIALKLAPGTSTLQFSSFGFDASCYEIFNTLLSGGKLVMPQNEDLLSPERFEKLVKKHKVDVGVFPPSFQHVVKNSFGTIKTIVSAGEPLERAMAMHIQSNGIRLINAYGPTENTVCTTLSDDPLKENNVTVIGKPVSNVSVYILNVYNQLSPVGVSGEICIGGVGVARGYLNRLELTAEKFISDPFSKNPGSRLYKSGDIGRWLPDGNLEYLGRKDDQVKIRGYRIELGEIESCLLQSGLVSQAVVLAREDTPGLKRLVGYVVAAGALDKAALEVWLQSKLPVYMVPAIWVELEHFPVTSNGKIDKKALPVPELEALSATVYTAPRNEAEAQLAGIWKELLHLERVGIHDNFFGLGGDSILTIQVVSRARRLGFELQPKDLFIHQTIARLSVSIAERSASEAVGEQGILTGLSGLLPIQHWYLEMDQPGNDHFNQGVLLSIDKVVTAGELGQAFTRLAEHHDALRFKYYQHDGQWQQEYGTYKGEVFTTSLELVAPGSLTASITAAASIHQQSLDTAKGELIRIVLMQTPAQALSNRLLIVVHHLATDGVSWRILLDDLELLLNGLKSTAPVTLGAKTSSYRQWYEALVEYSGRRRLLLQLSYWVRPANYNYVLPVDNAYTGAVKVQDTLSYTLCLNAAQTSLLLQQVPQVYHTEINDILLAALAKTLSDWSGNPNVCIGMEGHGREDIQPGIDTSRTIGWFTSLYPLYLSVPAVTGEGDLIKSIKEQLRQLPDKGLGYGVLRYINKEAALQGTEPWEIVFNYLGQLDNVVRESKWLSGSGESQGAGRSEEHLVQEKLSVNSFVRAGELVLTWSYSSKHYEEASIKKLSAAYLSDLEKLITHCLEQQKDGEVINTPSDYGLGSEITYGELDRFLALPYNEKKQKDSIESIYRLSGLQEGMLFHSLYDVGLGAYIEQFSCDLSGVNLAILNKSWSYLISRHSILRSGFYVDVFTVPVQCVYKEVVLPVVELDYRGMSGEEQQLAIKEFEASDKIKGFDFTTAPLMRLGLLRLSEERYRMIWTSHHILFDGWSLSILMEEFLSSYELLSAGKAVVAGQEDYYEDYIRYIERSDKEQEEQYWRNYLDGLGHSTLLPFIGSTPERNKGRGLYQSLHLKVDAAVAAKIHEYAQRHHITLNTIMQGVWSYLLHHYTGNENIVYGVVVSGRPDDLPGVEQRVGMYINTLPLHTVIKQDADIAGWLQGLQSEQVSSRQYQHTPLQTVQGWSGIQGDLFDTLLTFENYPVSKILNSRQWILDVMNVNVEEQTNYPLSIIIGSAEEISIVFSYNTVLLEEIYVKEIRGHFENVLLQVLQKEKVKVSDLNLLTSPEQQQILFEFNQPVTLHTTNKTIIDLFEEQVEKTPQAVAVVCGSTSFTYQELNAKSNQLAFYLKQKGIKEKALVPVFIENSLEMVISIWGIIKAGGAYVPIDIEYPLDRIQYILKDTKASVVVAGKKNLEKLSLATDRVIEIDSHFSLIESYPKDNLGENIKSDQLAYLIYTSGSTGQPKGVMIQHKSLLNYLVGSMSQYRATTGTAGSFVHLSPTFDASLTALFMPLLYGKSIVIGTGKSINIFEDKNLIKYAPYDFIKLTPSHLELIWPAFKAFGKIPLAGKLIVGGEALNAAHFKSFTTNNIDLQIINEYGPTETTVGCSTYEFYTYTDIEKIKDGIKIGKPVSNVSVYILNVYNQLSPVGVSGEICIGGVGVARGYLNRLELTAEKFISDPFSKNPGSRLYKSGDIGRWLPDGNLEYLGRKDDQVKIRGYRIELGEIESCLLQSGLVSQAVVLAREDTPGLKRLVGYVVAAGALDKAALEVWLQSKLPVYMVPAIWVELEHFPVTSNGKIDKKALPVPELEALSATVYTAPRNEAEAQLAGIWKELLHLERVGIHDNFFGLGGDSILTIQVVSRARRLGFELQPKDLFIHQTIARLSVSIAERSASEAVGEQGILTGLSGLLPIQHWYLEMDQPGNDHFNQGVLLSIDKVVTAGELGQAFTRLAEHHDALRFKYYQHDGQWQQEYGTYKGEVFTTSLELVAPGSLTASITAAASIHQQSLDTAKGELIRIVLMQTPAQALSNRLLIVVHHLATDGVSWRILLDDLELLLNGLKSTAPVTLGAKTSSYRQWYEALVEYSGRRRLLLQLSYWVRPANYNYVLPVDNAYTGAVKVQDTLSYTLCLNAAQTSLLLQQVPQVYHTEINDILLAALAKTLSDWSGNPNVCIGMEGHGREDIQPGIDTSRTIGWFTSLYPLYLSVPAVTGEGDLIKSIKEQLRQLPDKGLGYGVLRYINKEAALQGTEPWEIVFNYLGQLDNVVRESKWLSGSGESQGAGRSEEHLVQEKLSVNSFVRAGELVLTWSYSSKHYEEASIKKLSAAYLSDLEKLITHCLEQQKDGEVINTPSDYGLGSEITYGELDRFLALPYNEKKQKDSIESIYRLSGLQEGMLFHSLYDVGLGAYIEQFSCDLSGVNLAILNKSWSYLISRHSILRSGFYVDVFTVPVQCVYKEVVLPVVELDYRGMSGEEQQLAIKEFEASDKIKGFDFTTAPLMRLGLLRLSEERYRMIWTSHHILFDGWSLSILMEEFLSSYELLSAGKAVVAGQEDYYEDYIRYIERSDKEQEEQYWRNYLDGLGHSTLLPFIGSTPERNKGRGLYQSLHLKVDAAVAAKIHEYAQRHHITLNTIMQGVWSYLLHHYTGNENIVYGVVVSGRPDDLPGVEQRVGMYINTLPLHTVIKQDADIAGWLQGLQSEQVSSRQYQHTPLQTVQGWSGIQGDLFDTLLTFENYPVSKILNSRQWILDVMNVNVEEQTNYPLSIIIGSAEEISIVFSYNTVLLEEIYVKEIRGHFENVLLQVLQKEKVKVSDLNLLTSPEQQQILFEFNQPVTLHTTNKTIIDLFEEQVEKTPQAVAVVCGSTSFTYQELNAKSNQLAFYLKQKGIKEKALVPICIERSLEMIVGLLAILKVGAAYVPIDPEYPIERILFTLEDIAADFIITSKKNIHLLPKTNQVNFIYIDNPGDDISKQPEHNLKLQIVPDQLAYIIYTSGSTGRPKGVMIQHSNVFSFILWCQKEFEKSNFEIVYAVTSVCFDLSVFEVFYPLSIGKPLRLLENGLEIGKYISADRMIMVNTVPGIVQNFIASNIDLGNITVLNMAGEPVSPYILQGINTDKIEVRNLYGPTESTTYSTSTHLQNTIPINIGKPVTNTQIYILNKEAKLVPVGVMGEICITGAGLAKGYFKREELTAEKFVTNNFNKECGVKMYKTGDLGRWLPNGNIEYFGRMDEQVKVRGYRIELGEVETAILQSELVCETALVTKQDKVGNINRLVAYVVPKELFQKELMIAQLKTCLPNFMIPDLWIEIEKMPLTANGKIDKKALPDPDNILMGNTYTPPGSETEEILVQIWEDLLQVKRVGINDNFFELGGNSLLAMRMVAYIERSLSISIPIKVLFQFTCIAELGKYLEVQLKNNNTEDVSSFTLYEV